MSVSVFDDLPEGLKSVRTRALFVMQLSVRPLLNVSPTRRIGVVFGGSFDGERVSGEVLDGGADWLTFDAKGGSTLDVRLVLKTRDEALIGMTYQGIRHGPPEVMEKMRNGEIVDPASYYFRTVARFETAAAPYAWLNGILAIGVGHRLSGGPVYSLFEVL
jgi:hypothetical protein